MTDWDEWPADPGDPRCPECGGPVAATSAYCMHCEADLPGADFDVAETTSGVDADFATDADVLGEERGGTATGDDGGRGWLHPDGLLDDASTLGVGVVGGLLAGVVATVELLFPLPTYWPFAVGVVVWIAGTVWIAYTPSVFGAIRKAGYLLAVLLGLLPVLFAVSAPMAEDTLGQRAGLLVVLGILVWPVAAVAGGAGYLGRWIADRRS